MRASIVIRSRNEADRLRLTLTSLERQTAPAEVVVADDGSSDHTQIVLAEAARRMPLTIIRHSLAQGRSAASNAGAAKATGDIVIFLDGDTLAGPRMVESHLQAHVDRGEVVARGMNFNIRAVRFLRDPEQATAMPGQEARLAAATIEEIDRMRVTRQAILNDFASIEAMARPGVYPGVGPAELMRLEFDALVNHPDCAVLWAAAAGSNMSVRRDALLAAGGFRAELDIDAHRELALRLCMGGARMQPAMGAATYHLTHRSGWRNPLIELDWERIFYAAHPIPAVRLLIVFWASLSSKPAVPESLRINSLLELDEVSRRSDLSAYEEARRNIVSRMSSM